MAVLWAWLFLQFLDLTTSPALTEANTGTSKSTATNSSMKSTATDRNSNSSAATNSYSNSLATNVGDAVVATGFLSMNLTEGLSEFSKMCRYSCLFFFSSCALPVLSAETKCLITCFD